MGRQCYIGIDVGGTKTAAGVIDDLGRIAARKKLATPREAARTEFAGHLIGLIESTLSKAGLSFADILGIGIGVPGIVDSAKGLILSTPNINLSNFSLGAAVEERLKIKTVIGNDVNLGVLAERWLGKARRARIAVGVFPGTGLGGGILINDRLLTGHRGAAAEIGHMIIDPGGPACTCGNRGCWEAFTSRWAIERDIRQALENGKSSIVTELGEGRLDSIKSGILAEALRKGDPLVTGICEKVSSYLGLGCISLRHIFDPDVIIFGGGLIEACGKFMMPVIRRVFDSDPFFTNISRCRLVESHLEDDAVILGAVCYLKEHLGGDPFSTGPYPEITRRDNKTLFVDEEELGADMFIRADGKIRKRKKAFLDPATGDRRTLGGEEIARVTAKGADILIVAAGPGQHPSLTEDARTFLNEEGIHFRILPVEEALKEYNTGVSRKAFLMLGGAGGG